jgi:hypothetical protein
MIMEKYRFFEVLNKGVNKRVESTAPGHIKLGRPLGYVKQFSGKINHHLP